MTTYNPVRRGWITRQEIVQLRELHPLRAVSRIVAEYAVIFLLIWGNVQYFHWLSYFLSIIIIASRQHALMVLIHDAAHYLICKNRLLNDLVAEIYGWTLFASMRGYRIHHHGHHVQRNINTMMDPDFSRKQNGDWAFPMSRGRLYLLLLGDVLGLGIREYVRELRDSKNIVFKTPADRAYGMGRLCFYALQFGLISYYGLWAEYILFWVIPFVTFTRLFLRIRSVVDHFMLPNTHLLDRTRTILANPIERLLLGPCNISIHNEHHLYCTVPYYNLRRLHHRLMENPEYRQTIVIDSSYWDVLFRRCVRQPTLEAPPSFA